MSRAQDRVWKVGPHGPLVQLAENLWRVEAPLHGEGSLTRCMVVVRVPDGRLLIHNGIAMDEAQQTALEGLGEPTWLVVPNGWHRIDAARYKARYPSIRVVGPAGARRQIERKVALDATFADPLEGVGDAVRLEHLAGTREREGVVLARTGDGVTAVFNDAIFNLEMRKGVFWFVYGRLLGAAGRPTVTPLIRLFLLRDKRAFAAHLRRIADEPGLRRVLVAHGRPIEEDAPRVLREIATRIGGPA